VTHFADQTAWPRHLDRLGFYGLSIEPDPVQIATEGAIWGSIKAHRFLCDAVVLSDDAGQFNLGQHALCWVHAERPVTGWTRSMTGAVTLRRGFAA
jgi:hypothetical protein